MKNNQRKIYRYTAIGHIFRLIPFLAFFALLIIIFITLRFGGEVQEVSKNWLIAFLVYALLAALVHIIIQPAISVKEDGLYIRRLGRFYKIEWDMLNIYKAKGIIFKMLFPIPRFDLILVRSNSRNILNKFFIISPFITNFDELLNKIKSHCPNIRT